MQTIKNVPNFIKKMVLHRSITQPADAVVVLPMVTLPPIACKLREIICLGGRFSSLLISMRSAQV